MLPLQELEFYDLLNYMKSDKIKVYKLGGIRFLKIQGVITLYYRYNDILMNYIKSGENKRISEEFIVLLDFKEFINYYYNNSISNIKTYSKQKKEFLDIKDTLSDKLYEPNKRASTYFDGTISKNTRIKDFIINRYSEYLI